MGSARTALYDFLFARRTGGQFILRIEDTDRKRFVPGAEQELIDGLHWLGITWDEGPDVGGPCGPYSPSERGGLPKPRRRPCPSSGMPTNVSARRAVWPKCGRNSKRDDNSP
jgi:glutamyl-tRNA synthetase